MTNKEISKIFEISLSTINDWQKEDSNRYKLYQFLHATNVKDVRAIRSQQKDHRLFHILNRNIEQASIYSVKEVKKAFSHKNYNNASLREQVIYSKFFKECDVEDLATLLALLNISIRDVKQIYTSSPLRKFKGVREIWDRRFRIKLEKTQDTAMNNVIPSALSLILKKRDVYV